MPQRILIIDDDAAHADTVVDALHAEDRAVDVSYGSKSAFTRLEERAYDLVITDLVMRGADGMDVLRTVREKFPNTEVIMVTGYGSAKQAVEAMQAGAYTFLEKPLDLPEVRAKVAKALEKAALTAKQRDLEQRLDRRFGLEAIVGESPGIQRVLDLIPLIARTNATVLIIGENGTGKELVAQALHQLSPRRPERFVALNCAAIHETLLESELFGHARGAFTDARTEKEGKFEYAHRGTLFLDEIGDLSPNLQPKFLRVLENGVVTRLGEHEERKVDVRVVAATNQDMERAMEERRFRRDLFFRLSTVRIELPPLRERKSDIPLLVDSFLKQANEAHHQQITRIAPEVLRLFSVYDWPGNVRELRNTIHGMVILASGHELSREQVPPHLVAEKQKAPESLESFLGRPLEDLERLHITQSLSAVRGNREKAAKMLGISERTLYRKIKRWGEGTEPLL